MMRVEVYRDKEDKEGCWVGGGIGEEDIGLG
jgi:hypothetical protein